MLILTAERDGGFRMLRKLLFCLALLVVAGPATADDAMLCSTETGDAAVAACTRAINSGAGRPSINYNSRGEAYRSKGDMDRAIADYTEALRLDPKNAIAYVNRGLIYENLADFARARADFNATLGLSQEGTEWLQEKARERLATLSAPPPATALFEKSSVVTAIVTPTAPVLNNDRRIALVIGNSAYENAAALPNPERDANLVADALKRTGFETVTLLTNLRKNALVTALRGFAARAETADWAVVYYAGHGMEVGGINYLIPTDAKIAADRDIGFEAVPLEQVLNAAERAKKLRLVILDACRVNPFANQMKRTQTVASRSVSRGLAAVEPEAGTLVVYAAKDGETADLEVRRLFDFLRDDVMEATGRKQKPFSYGSISGRQDFYFVAGNANLARARLDELKASANGAMPNNEPHGIKTPAMKGDASENVAPVAQRVVLYEEDPSDPKDKQYVGSVIWRTEPIKASGNQKPEIALRADIEIPDRKFKMTMSFRRNTDTSLPASHTAELTFILPHDFSGGGVSNVPGILMKSDEQAPSHCLHKIATSTSTIATTKVASCGTPLAGLAVKVTDGFFLVGLSNVDADRTRNLQLLKERSWFDVPLIYANQHLGGGLSDCFKPRLRSGRGRRPHRLDRPGRRFRERRRGTAADRNDAQFGPPPARQGRSLHRAGRCPGQSQAVPCPLRRPRSGSGRGGLPNTEARRHLLHHRSQLILARHLK